MADLYGVTSVYLSRNNWLIISSVYLLVVRPLELVQVQAWRSISGHATRLTRYRIMWDSGAVMGSQATVFVLTFQLIAWVHSWLIWNHKLRGEACGRIVEQTFSLRKNNFIWNAVAKWTGVVAFVIREDKVIVSLPKDQTCIRLPYLESLVCNATQGHRHWPRNVSNTSLNGDCVCRQNSATVAKGGCNGIRAKNEKFQSQSKG